MSRGAATKAASRGGKRGKSGITTTLVLLPVFGFLIPTCVVLLIGMMPTVVAVMLDRGRSKHLATTVGLLNFCGTVPGLVELWREWQAYAAATRIVTDAFFWLTAFGAAAIGWAIYLLMPLLIGSLYGVLSNHRLEGLKHRQQQLVQAWGEEVIGEDGVDRERAGGS